MEDFTLKELNNAIDNESYFVIDNNVFKLYEDKLSSLKNKTVFFLDQPEQNKSLGKIEEAAVFFTEKLISRNDRIISIGGGATSDFTGFLASILLRGIDWFCIPTTILGVVDASIGGKTAVNLSNGKNLLGSFYSPKNIIISTEFIKTLPIIEKMSGNGEILKYCYLSKSIYDSVMNNDQDFDIYRQCQSFKIQIAQSDFKEQGQRKILNFGHTIGHALEKACNLPHGIAVAMGIELKLLMFKPELLDDFKVLKKNLNIEYEWPSTINKKDLERFLLKDKKRQGNNLEFIGLHKVGEPKISALNANSFIEKLYQLEKYGNIFK